MRPTDRPTDRARAVPASPIATAIAALELERENLSARLQKVDAAIVSMRELFHLPKPPAKANGAAPAAKRARGKASASVNGHRITLDVDAVRNALRRGPMAPGALAEELGVDRARLRYQLAKLEEQGVVAMSGTTAARRIALADGSAKEAP